MHYVSTRGEAASLDFPEVLLSGLARDGGLYMPERWPALDQETIAAFAGQPYWKVAAAVVAPFVGGAVPREALEGMAREAYATFRHPAVAPLIQLSPRHFLLELFHGPTLAFKDLAMQLLARLMDRVLKERGDRITIVGATSGDTGSAAIEAFRGLDSVDIVILFPLGRVSEVQRRQMTTVDAPNVAAAAVEGSFDDCQALVKAMFDHHSFRDRVRLSAVNSINWARIVAQTVYYFTAAVALGGPGRGVAFCVPTGNFGDVFAGYVAARMGLPVEKLMVATNVNDILVRSLATGRYQVRDVIATRSPSMDIQVSSNFERLLFEATGRDPGRVSSMMQDLARSGGFDIPDPELAQIRRLFSAHSADQRAMTEAMRRVRQETGYILDPHSAVAVAAAEAEVLESRVPLVTLATAHPAKFPDAVEQGTGTRPELPSFLESLARREERTVVLPNELSQVERFVASRSRAIGAAA